MQLHPVFFVVEDTKKIVSCIYNVIPASACLTERKAGISKIQNSGIGILVIDNS